MEGLFNRRAPPQLNLLSMSERCQRSPCFGAPASWPLDQFLENLRYTIVHIGPALCYFLVVEALLSYPLLHSYVIVERGYISISFLARPITLNAR
jgi:hypothetical protein